MTKILSEKNSLNKQDIKKLVRNMLIMYSGVIILFLDQIQAGTFDPKILYATALGTTLDAIRRYIREVIQ